MSLIELGVELLVKKNKPCAHDYLSRAMIREDKENSKGCLRALLTHGVMEKEAVASAYAQEYFAFTRYPVGESSEYTSSSTSEHDLKEPSVTRTLTSI